MYYTADIYFKDYTLSTDDNLLLYTEYKKEKYTVYESNDMRV